MASWKDTVKSASKVVWVGFGKRENLFAGTTETFLTFVPFNSSGPVRDAGESPFSGKEEMLEKLAAAKAQAEAMGGRLELSNQGRSMISEEVADEIENLLYS